MLIISALAMTLATPDGAPDYNRPEAWLCRPDRRDACSADLTATVIAADGTRKIERFKPAKRPTFDCFYLYPTVSTDPGLNSDLAPGREEIGVTQRQIARFRSICRVYAPLYRQVTLGGLRQIAAGGPAAAAAQATVYADVKAAWENYLKRDNDGRGVVLIGHSQGAVALKALIARDIDAKPVQARLISAVLLGANVAIPVEKGARGDFTSVTPCRTSTQTGCFVSYVAFRSDAPPPTSAFLGRVASPGIGAACTNPAALAGGAATLDPYFLTVARPNSVPPEPWSKDGVAVTTPFVRMPGLVSGECRTQDGATYLAITTRAAPSDRRTDQIGGDAQAGGVIQPSWGLHLIDMNLAMGDLISLVDRQATLWAKKRARRDR